MHLWGTIRPNRCQIGDFSFESRDGEFRQFRRRGYKFTCQQLMIELLRIIGGFIIEL